jgi:transposase
MVYPLAFRERVVSAIKEKGMSRKDVMAIFGVSHMTLTRWLHATDLTPPTTRNSKPWKFNTEQFFKILEATPDATLQEIADALGVSVLCVWYHCKKHKITRKKNHALPRARREKTARLYAGTGVN